MPYVQIQEQTGVPMPQELLCDIMWEEILPWLFSFDIQVEHNIKAAKVVFVEMSLHEKGVPMQELLPISKINLLYSVDRS